MQVRDAPHRQPRQVTHESPAGLGDGDRERADGRRLIHDEEDQPVTCELVEDCAQPCLVVRECLVEQPFPGPVERDGMVLALADVEPDEHVDVIVSVDAGDHFVLRFHS